MKSYLDESNTTVNDFNNIIQAINNNSKTEQIDSKKYEKIIRELNSELDEKNDLISTQQNYIVNTTNINNQLKEELENKDDEIVKLTHVTSVLYIILATIRDNKLFETK